MTTANGSSYMPLASTDNNDSSDDDNDQLTHANRTPTASASAAAATATTAATAASISPSASATARPPPVIRSDSPGGATSIRSASTSPSSDSNDWSMHVPRISDFNRNNIVKKNRSRDFRTMERIKFGNYSSNSVRFMRKKFCIGVLAIVIFILFLISNDNEERIAVMHYSHVPGMKGYLVWSERCKIPNVDPYLAEVMQHFKRQKYAPCTATPPLTRIHFDDVTKQYELQVIENNIGIYSKWGTLDCCYQSVERNYTGAKADFKVSYSTCIAFKRQTKLSSSVDNVLVTCKIKGKQVYRNGYALMPERQEIHARLAKFKKDTDHHPSDRIPNVLLIGIDSIARTHLIRAMPRTAQYLYDNEWFEMTGYNKIGDNTFPNLMAVLTGRNSTDAYETCKPTIVGSLDKCDIIWKAFREHGYVTAYAEDDISINTFNFLKKGFEHPPVDYYIRPFFLMAENQLKVRYKSGLVGCVGFDHAAQHVFNYAFELRRRYKDAPHFGLFWMNSFSHNSLSDCSSMDDKILEDLQELAKLGVFTDTVVIFFSDHGMRFGPARKTFSGRLEERLPFLFIWLPPFMKHAHPEIVNAMSINKNRLINPYDLHMTIKDILERTGRVKDPEYVGQALGCPRCQSLFRAVPHNRSCDDINIDDHWCTCTTFESIYKESKIVQRLVNFTLDHINNLVSTFDEGRYANMCIPLKLHMITEAFRAQHIKLDPNDNAKQEIYRILFRSSPNKGLFEATMRYDTIKQTFLLAGEVSRLNSYADDSKCIADNIVKKYCLCKKQ